MRGFELRLNGRILFVAGVDTDGVISANLPWVRSPGGRPGSIRSAHEQLGLTVGGLVARTREHVTWRPRRLRVGDELGIKIVETDRIDKPHRRQRSDPRKEVQLQKAYVRRLAKNLGWQISTRRVAR
jgi:hypothetical protein